MGWGWRGIPGVRRGQIRPIKEVWGRRPPTGCTVSGVGNRGRCSEGREPVRVTGAGAQDGVGVGTYGSSLTSPSLSSPELTGVTTLPACDGRVQGDTHPGPRRPSGSEKEMWVPVRRVVGPGGGGVTLHPVSGLWEVGPPDGPEVPLVCGGLPRLPPVRGHLLLPRRGETVRHGTILSPRDSVP